MGLMPYAIQMASKYYDEDDYAHVLRVMTHVANNRMIPDDIREDCMALAVMHDLIETTNWSGGFGDEYEHFKGCLNLISKPKDMNYIDHIKKIHEYADVYPEAYWVAIADIKDRLLNIDTLTEQLRTKYIEALPYLL